jgi:hypothetical protein
MAPLRATTGHQVHRLPLTPNIRPDKASHIGTYLTDTVSLINDKAC